MKQLTISVVLLLLVGKHQSQTNSGLLNYASQTGYNKEKQLNFVKLDESARVADTDVPAFVNRVVFENGINSVSVLKTERDDYGFTHTRYAIRQNNIPIYNKMIVSHSKNGVLQTLNGDLKLFAPAVNARKLSEKKALSLALAKVNAKVYKWQDKAAEAHMREVLKDPGFTFYPKAVATLYEKGGSLYHAYQFDIYASKPLYHANVFVDAESGSILGEAPLICNINVPGSMATKYSGTQTVTVDQTGSTYRMRESVRGLGVETYNMQNALATPIDFTNNSATWTGVNNDQGARDAHWGAEKTWDYYFYQHNRNSVDNAGFMLQSFVHFDVDFTNAFWDGFSMTYGDGDPSMGYGIFTALDVCGHEITHGLTQNTSNLDYFGESGALNESYSDIFGTCIENYARPGNWNWKMGEDVTLNNNGFRSMANPNGNGDPDTYNGNFWYVGLGDAGGVHTNSGVSNYWFYLLCTGGAGTNDLGNSYNVSGLGMTAASRIAFRALTVYYIPNTDFVSARLLSIQAAIDLYGNCSNEVIQTINAWHAVGLGNAFVNGQVNPDFTTLNTNLCNLPAIVNFNNTTPMGFNYQWTFGDGGTSTLVNPSHIYNAAGTYTVKLKAYGCGNVVDSIIKPAYININPPASPVTQGASRCGPGAVTLNASGNGQLNWYNNPVLTNNVGNGTSFTTPSLQVSTNYYVTNSITFPVSTGGKTSNTGGGYQNLAFPENGIAFLVQQYCQLNSVVMYASNAGPRTIELTNLGGFNTVNSTVVNLSAGANTVTLNYTLNPGTYYMLGLAGGSACNLYRSTTGVSFPYSVGSFLQLLGSIDEDGDYYWFYNWKVSKPGCASAPVAVTASIDDLPEISLSASANSICAISGSVIITALPQGGVLSGSGLSGNYFVPVSSGTFPISYTYTDTNNCSANSSLNMIVLACTGIDEQSTGTSGWQLSPNPANNYIAVSRNGNDTETTICIADASGRLLRSTPFIAQAQQLDVSDLAQGVYFVRICDREQRTLKTWKLVRQ